MVVAAAAARRPALVWVEQGRLREDVLPPWRGYRRTKGEKGQILVFIPRKQKSGIRGLR